MYQRISIIGNLGRDPNMRVTPQGRSVTDMSVATNRKWTGSDGVQHEDTAWFRVTCWGALAEVANQYLAKGRQVYVEGRLQPDPETGGPRIWTDNQGQQRASFEVVADTVKFLGNGQRNEASNDTPGDIPF